MEGRKGFKSKEKASAIAAVVIFKLDRTVLVFLKVGSGFSPIKRYCKECFQNILKQTQKDLEEAKKL